MSLIMKLTWSLAIFLISTATVTGSLRVHDFIKEKSIGGRFSYTLMHIAYVLTGSTMTYLIGELLSLFP